MNANQQSWENDHDIDDDHDYHNMVRIKSMNIIKMWWTFLRRMLPIYSLGNPGKTTGWSCRQIWPSIFIIAILLFHSSVHDCDLIYTIYPRIYSEYRLLPVEWLHNIWRPDSFFKNAKQVLLLILMVIMIKKNMVRCLKQWWIKYFFHVK